MVLTFSGEEGREIIFGDNEDFTELEDQHREEKSGRWSIGHTVVFKQKSTGKFFTTFYRTGATESQDEQPFEYSRAEFTEVEPVEVTVTKYVKVKDNVDKNS